MYMGETAHAFVCISDFGCAKNGRRDGEILPLSMDMGKTLMKFMHSIDFGRAMDGKPGISMSGGTLCNPGAAMLLVSMDISKTVHVFMHNSSFGCAKIGESNLFLISMDMGKTAHEFMYNRDLDAPKSRHGMLTSPMILRARETSA